MRDRRLCADARGWGRSVHAIQRMPPTRVRNADGTMQAIVAACNAAASAAQG
jgi:dihydroorotase